MKSGLPTLIAAALLAGAAVPARGAALVKEQRIAEPHGAPIKAPLARSEVVERLAAYSRRAVAERGEVAAAAAFRRLNAASGKAAAARALPAPEERARWLAGTGDDGVAAAYCGNPGLMSADAYALFLDQFGIEIRYILDADGAEGDVLQCADLPEVVAQLLNYPDQILYYLGHATPGMEIRLYAPGVSAGCGLADACAGAGIVNLQDGDADATVHETAHALQYIAISNNQNDPANPLKGRKAEFDAVFSIPPEYAGLVTYADFYGPDGVVHLSGPLEETPPGFLDQYAMISDWENFAQTCKYYVGSPKAYLKTAHIQAWEEQIELCLKYRFAYRRVFLYRSFTDLLAPQTCLVSLRPVDKGDGDGRVEPGEYFALDLSIVPLDDHPSATHLRCLPSEVKTTVICVATSEFASGLKKGKRYDFPAAFDYRLSPYFTGETNRTFNVSYYTQSGALALVGQDFVPLNEGAYFWGWVTGEEPGATMVRMTSTMRTAEAVQWPEALLESIEQAEHLLYDEQGDRFWIASIDPTVPVLRIPRSDPGAFESFAVDPYGALEGGELSYAALNPLDGALWLSTDESELVILRAGAGGEVTRQFLLPEDFTPLPWGGTRGMETDGASGMVWLHSGSTIVRLTPGGETDLEVGGFNNICHLSPAPGGGCWIAGGNYPVATLKKLSPQGAVQLTRAADVWVNEIMCHPLSGVLWALGTGDCPADKRLLCYTPGGALMSSRGVGQNSMGLFPCPSDATAYLRNVSQNWGAVRYQTYGGPLHTTIISLFDYRPFGSHCAVP